MPSLLSSMYPVIWRSLSLNQIPIFLFCGGVFLSYLLSFHFFSLEQVREIGLPKGREVRAMDTGK